MKIGVIGTGYVGLTQSVCMASYLVDHQLIGYDIDSSKIEKLQNGIPTIYEDGLEDLLKKDLEQGNLSFTSNLDDLIGCNVIFVAVGTPMGSDGKQVKDYLYAAFDSVTTGKFDYPHAVVIKSTVLPGTCEDLMSRLHDRREIVVCSNPEFLREGFALGDFLHPDKVVLGFPYKEYKPFPEDEKHLKLAISQLRTIYSPIAKNDTIVISSLFVAQVCKYINNDMLATKIAKVNEYRTLMNNLRDDEFDTLMRSLGLDSRVSPKFLVSGPGFGGSCFKKDTTALTEYAESRGLDKIDLPLLFSTIKSNENRAHWVANVINKLVGLTEKDLTLVLGTAFKAGTDDIRDSPALTIIEDIFNERCTLENLDIHDPQAIKNTREYFKDKNVGEYFDETDPEDIAHLIMTYNFIIVTTEWNHYKEAFKYLVDWHNYNPNLFNGKVFIDTRHIVPMELSPIQI